MSRNIEFRPFFSQPMVADLTMHLEKNPIFSDPDKESLARLWIDNELHSCKYDFDSYALSTMEGKMIRAIFLGMFLQKSIDARQMCILKVTPSV